MKNTILFLAIGCQFLLVAFCGCNNTKRCERRLARVEAKCPGLFQVKHDSSIKVVTKRIEHDSIIYVTQPDNTFTVTVPCPQADSLVIKRHFKQGNAMLSIYRGVATVQCPVDSLQEIICNIRDSVKTLEIKNTSGLATKTVTIEKPLSGFDEFAKYFSLIILLAAGSYFGAKYMGPIIAKIIKGEV